MSETRRDTGEQSVREYIAERAAEYQEKYPAGRWPDGYWQVQFYNNFFMHLPTRDDDTNVLGNYRLLVAGVWDTPYGVAYPKARYSELKMGQTPHEFYDIIDGVLAGQLRERGLDMDWMKERVYESVESHPRIQAYNAMGDLYVQLREMGYTPPDLDAKI